MGRSQRNITLLRLVGGCLAAVLCVGLPQALAKVFIVRFGLSPEGLAFFGKGPSLLWLLPIFWWVSAGLAGIGAGLLVASRFCTRDQLRRVLLGDREIRFVSPVLSAVLTTLYGYDSRIPSGRKSARQIRGLTILAGLLGVAVVASTCVLASLAGRERLWQETATSQARGRGFERALFDFHEGKVRLYEISGRCMKTAPTGRKDGPFEIWRLANPDFGAEFRWELASFADGYNEKMRYMQAHPAKFRSAPQPQTLARQ